MWLSSVSVPSTESHKFTEDVYVYVRWSLCWADSRYETDFTASLSECVHSLNSLPIEADTYLPSPSPSPSKIQIRNLTSTPLHESADALCAPVFLLLSLHLLFKHSQRRSFFNSPSSPSSSFCWFCEPPPSVRYLDLSFFLTRCLPLPLSVKGGSLRSIIHLRPILPLRLQSVWPPRLLSSFTSDVKLAFVDIMTSFFWRGGYEFLKKRNLVGLTRKTHGDLSYAAFNSHSGSWLSSFLFNWSSVFFFFFFLIKYRQRCLKSTNRLSNAFRYCYSWIHTRRLQITQTDHVR